MSAPKVRKRLASGDPRSKQASILNFPRNTRRGTDHEKGILELFGCTGAAYIFTVSGLGEIEGRPPILESILRRPIVDFEGAEGAMVRMIGGNQEKT